MWGTRSIHFTRRRMAITAVILWQLAFVVWINAPSGENATSPSQEAAEPTPAPEVLERKVRQQLTQNDSYSTDPDARPSAECSAAAAVPASSTASSSPVPSLSPTPLPTFQPPRQRWSWPPRSEERVLEEGDNYRKIQVGNTRWTKFERKRFWNETAVQRKLWAVTAVFNPEGYKSRTEVFHVFRKHLRRQKVNLLVIELGTRLTRKRFTRFVCTKEYPKGKTLPPLVSKDDRTPHGDCKTGYKICSNGEWFCPYPGSEVVQTTDLGPLTLGPSDGEIVLQTYSDQIMWHKERMYNLAVGHLPAEVEKVVFIDSDVRILNDDWPSLTSAALDTTTIVQPFEGFVRLDAGEVAPCYECSEMDAQTFHDNPAYFHKVMGPYSRSDSLNWAKAVTSYADPCLDRASYRTSGLVQAFQRRFLEDVGVFDYLICGGGDVTMFAMATMEQCSSNSTLMRHMHHILPTTAVWNSYQKYSSAVMQQMNISVGYVPNVVVMHYFHGTERNRQYSTRSSILELADYDPVSDVEIHAKTGLFMWSKSVAESNAKSTMRNDIEKFFTLRREFTKRGAKFDRIESVEDDRLPWPHGTFIKKPILVNGELDSVRRDDKKTGTLVDSRRRPSPSSVDRASKANASLTTAGHVRTAVSASFSRQPPAEKVAILTKSTSALPIVDPSPSSIGSSPPAPTSSGGGVTAGSAIPQSKPASRTGGPAVQPSTVSIGSAPPLPDSGVHTTGLSPSFDPHDMAASTPAQSSPGRQVPSERPLASHKPYERVSSAAHVHSGPPALGSSSAVAPSLLAHSSVSQPSPSANVVPAVHSAAPTGPSASCTTVPEKLPIVPQDGWTFPTDTDVIEDHEDYTVYNVRGTTWTKTVRKAFWNDTQEQRDTWVVTSIFNPAGYQSKRVMFSAFRRHMRRQGVNVLAIEVAFDRVVGRFSSMYCTSEYPPGTALPSCKRSSDPLPHKNCKHGYNKCREGKWYCPHPDATVEKEHMKNDLILTPDDGEIVLQTYHDTIMWQKERMYNLAVHHLPPEAKNVVYVDCDIRFVNDDWLYHVTKRLDMFQMVMPYEVVVRVQKNERSPCYNCDLTDSKKFLEQKDYAVKFAGRYSAAATENWAHVVGPMKDPCLRAMMYERFRTPGHAHAFRIPFVKKYGVYDRLIVGGGDAACLAVASILKCQKATEMYRRMSKVLTSQKLMTDYLNYVKTVNPNNTLTVSDVPNVAIVHFFHGTKEMRMYASRGMVYTDAKFDPERDVVVNATNGLFSWAENRWKASSGKHSLPPRTERYFFARREDVGFSPASVDPILAADNSTIPWPPHTPSVVARKRSGLASIANADADVSS